MLIELLLIDWKHIKRSELTKLFPLGFEPRTFRVLGERDNHYTTETDTSVTPKVIERVNRIYINVLETRDVCHQRSRNKRCLLPLLFSRTIFTEF